MARCGMASAFAQHNYLGIHHQGSESTNVCHTRLPTSMYHTVSLMQKLNPSLCIPRQSTYLPKLPNLLPSPRNPLRKLLKWTTPPRSPVTTRQCYDAIIDVNPDKVLLLPRRLAVPHVRVPVLGFIPAALRSRAGEALEDDAAAHWYEVGGAERAVKKEVGGG